MVIFVDWITYLIVKCMQAVVWIVWKLIAVGVLLMALLVRSTYRAGGLGVLLVSILTIPLLIVALDAWGAIGALFVGILMIALTIWVWSRKSSPPQETLPQTFNQAPLTNGYYSQDREWWWNEGNQQWYMVDPNHKTYLDIEVAEVGTYWLASFALNFIGGFNSVAKCQFIARPWDDDGRYEPITTIDFTKDVAESFDDMLLNQHEYAAAQERLDWLDAMLRADGWILGSKDPVHWYSYRYWRPQIVLNTPPGYEPEDSTASSEVSTNSSNYALQDAYKELPREEKEQQRQLPSPLKTPTGDHNPQNKLAAVRGTIALSPEEALDEAQAFLTGLGYTDVSRVDSSLRAERHPPVNGDGQKTLFLTVTATPQPGGGVRISLSGDDGEGVLEYQAEWSAWSENLPKQPGAQTENAGEQRIEEATDVSQQQRPPMAGTFNFCPNCGRKAQAGENFCPECGHKLRL